MSERVEPGALRAPSDAKPCPACGHMAPWADFKRAGGCPSCDRTLNVLLDMAAGDA